MERTSRVRKLSKFPSSSTKLSITRSSHLWHFVVIEILCPRRQLPKGIPRRCRDFLNGKHSRVTGVTNFCYLFIRTKLTPRFHARTRVLSLFLRSHVTQQTNVVSFHLSLSRCILVVSWFPELAKNENAKLPRVWNSLRFSRNHLLWLWTTIIRYGFAEMFLFVSLPIFISLPLTLWGSHFSSEQIIEITGHLWFSLNTIPVRITKLQSSGKFWKKYIFRYGVHA